MVTVSTVAFREFWVLLLNSNPDAGLGAPKLAAGDKGEGCPSTSAQLPVPEAEADSKETGQGATV